MGARTVVEGVGRDAWFAVRSLLRSRPLAAAAALVLALGIGANVAIFAVVDALLLRPLPFRDPGRLAVVFETLPGRRSVRLTVSAPAFQDLRRSGAFEDLAALARSAGSLDRGDHAEPVTVSHATAGLMPLLGVQMQLGRPFDAGEDAPGRDRVAILSDSLFRQRFAADPAVVGRSILLDGVERVVAGVLPARLSLFFPGDVWVPLPFTADQLAPERREYGLLLAIGRAADVSAAQQQASALAERLLEAHPGVARAGFLVVPLREVFLGDLRPALLLLLGAVAVVLLVACANVANLLLARAAARQKELAVRAALGADRPLLARQLVLEGVVLALFGCGLGILLALWAIEVLAPLASEAIRSGGIEVSERVLAFAALVSVAAGAAAGLVPAVQATRPDLAAQLKDAARRTAWGGRRRIRDALVVLEVALALILLIAAAHDFRAFRRVLGRDPGFDPRGALVMEMALPPGRFGDPAAQERFFSELVARVSAARGVEAAGFVATVPLSGMQTLWHFDVEGPGGRGSGHVVEHLQVYSAGTASALRVPVLEGRGFGPADGGSAPRVALVNQALARRYWPGESAVGKRIRAHRFHFEDASGRRFWPLEEPTWAMVVGVISDVHQARLSVEPRPEVILPLAQFPLPEGAVISRGGTPDALRAVLASLDPDVAAQRIVPLREIVASSAEQQRDPVILLSLLAALALLMAGMGLYGAMSWLVAERGRELSIRMALGAHSVHVLRDLLAYAFSLVGSGTVAGLVAAVLLAGPLSTVAAGVYRLDPGLCAALALSLVPVALLACWVPARRASRIDPKVAFRVE